MKIIFYLSLFVIFWANIGYPMFIKILGRIVTKDNKVNIKNLPTVTIMVVAHNEEKVILDKLNNLLKIDYPVSLLEILIASDNSTDKTNLIVEKFIKNHSDRNINLFKAVNRMGKTNAQNEAQKKVKSEILVMTDANSMLKSDSIRHLVSSFVTEDIAYVTGLLKYINDGESNSSESESTYWNLEVEVREIEGRIQTITAGNGALYACRNEEYIDFDPIESHDSAMPTYFALQGKRAITNHQAIAYEKAGETYEDEFNRKVRMNRVLLSHILPDANLLNIFKYRWFTFFYLGHRTSRYLLWLAHLLLFISNIVLSFNSYFYIIILIFHLLILFLATFYHYANIQSKIIKLIYYYCVTIVAQFVGIYKTMTGQSKPFWEKAESTR